MVPVNGGHIRQVASLKNVHCIEMVSKYVPAEQFMGCQIPLPQTKYFVQSSGFAANEPSSQNGFRLQESTGTGVVDWPRVPTVKNHLIAQFDKVF